MLMFTLAFRYFRWLYISLPTDTQVCGCHITIWTEFLLGPDHRVVQLAQVYVFQKQNVSVIHLCSFFPPQGIGEVEQSWLVYNLLLNSLGLISTHSVLFAAFQLLFLMLPTCDLLNMWLAHAVDINNLPWAAANCQKQSSHICKLSVLRPFLSIIL